MKMTKNELIEEVLKHHTILLGLDYMLGHLSATPYLGVGDRMYQLQIVSNVLRSWTFVTIWQSC
jgi:hypothetical protein